MRHLQANCEMSVSLATSFVLLCLINVPGVAWWPWEFDKTEMLYSGIGHSRCDISVSAFQLVIQKTKIK